MQLVKLYFFRQLKWVAGWLTRVFAHTSTGSLRWKERWWNSCGWHLCLGCQVLEFQERRGRWGCRCCGVFSPSASSWSSGPIEIVTPLIKSSNSPLIPVYGQGSESHWKNKQKALWWESKQREQEEEEEGGSPGMIITYFLPMKVD